MKLGTRPRSHMVDLLFVLALFCVFAASALMAVLIGANVYRNTVRRMDENYTGRTSLAYIATKVRQCDVRDGIHIGAVGNGASALVLRQEIDGQEFETWIYCYDGALREVLLPADSSPDPESGQAVVEMDSFDVDARDGLLTVSVKDVDGNRYSRQIAVRCGFAASE